MQALTELWRKANQKWLDPLLKANILNMRVIWVGVVGILLLVFGNLLAPQEKTPEVNAPPMAQMPIASKLPESRQELIEQRLAQVLSKVRGAGQVSVAVTLDGGSVKEHAKNVVRETKIVEEKDTAGSVRTTTETKENEEVILSRESGADQPVIVREIEPEIKGVLIVAEGAADSMVKSQLTRAAETGLGIASYKITVLPQRK